MPCHHIHLLQIQLNFLMLSHFLPVIFRESFLFPPQSKWRWNNRIKNFWNEFALIFLLLWRIIGVYYYIPNYSLRMSVHKASSFGKASVWIQREVFPYLLTVRLGWIKNHLEDGSRILKKLVLFVDFEKSSKDLRFGID